MAFQRMCEECDRVFDMLNAADADEWAHGHDCEPFYDETPPCALAMGCLCACHAAGLDAGEPCDTSEARAREITECEA